MLLREDGRQVKSLDGNLVFRIHEAIHRQNSKGPRGGGTPGPLLRLMTKSYRKCYVPYDSRGHIAGKRFISTRSTVATYPSRLRH
jgi:hypothetical protein